MVRHKKSADAATGLNRCPSTTMEALGPLAAVPALQYGAETSKSAHATAAEQGRMLTLPVLLVEPPVLPSKTSAGAVALLPSVTLVTPDRASASAFISRHNPAIARAQQNDRVLAWR